MPNWNKLDEALENQDGVDGYLVFQLGGDASSSKHREDAGNCWKAFNRKVIYRHAVRVLLSAQGDASQIEVQLNETKVIAFLWDHYVFVVEVIRGHNVNKSIQRTVRRLRRTYDKPGVQYSPWNVSPPAASSSVPRTEASSPSLEVAPSTTGDCQGDPSSQASLSSSVPNENSGKKPESDSGQTHI